MYGHIFGGSNFVKVMSDTLFTGYSIRFLYHTSGSYSIYFIRNSSIVMPLDAAKVIANIYVNYEAYAGRNNIGVNNINVFNNSELGSWGGIEIHYTTSDDSSSNDATVSFFIHYIVGSVSKTITRFTANTNYPLL